MRKILPDRTKGSVDELEQWIDKEKDAKYRNRLNGIRLLRLNYTKEQVSEICQVSRVCVREWVKKWNISGKEGLKTKSGGSKSKVDKSVRLEIEKVVEKRVATNGEVITGKWIRGYLKKNTKSK